MWAIAKHELRHKRAGLLAYSLGIIVLTVMFTAMYPSIRDSAQQIADSMKNFPPQALKAFNITGLDYDTIEKFMSKEIYSIILPIMLICMALARAGNSVAGEIERGSMGLLLNLPVGRRRIFAGKYAAGMIAIIIFSFIACLGLAPVAAAFNIPVGIHHLLAAWLLTLLFGWSVFALGMLISVSSSEKSRVYSLVSGILVVMYVLNVVAVLKNSLDGLKYVSLFYYYNAPAVVEGTPIMARSIIVMGGFAVAATLLAMWRFNQRDISV